MRVRSGDLTSAVIVVFGLAIAGPAAAACDSANALFEDNFESLDSSWGAPDDAVSAKDGSLVLKPAAGYWRFVPSESDLYQDVSVCVDATIAAAPKEDASSLGILFWFADWNNVYIFEYYATGAFAVERLSKGKWLLPVPYTENPAIKKGVGQTNQLEVKMKGKQATIFINGTQVAQFKGVAPPDGGKVGLAGVSPAEGVATYKFQNFIVSEPSP
jgi:hypothetical protein